MLESSSRIVALLVAETSELSDDYAAIAQLVERIHGKDEVSGSSPDRGSRIDFSIFDGAAVIFVFTVEKTRLIEYRYRKYPIFV